MPTKLNQTAELVIVVAIFQKPKPKRILNVGEVVKNVANANAIEASRPACRVPEQQHPLPVTSHRPRQPAKRIFSYKLEFRLGPN